MSLEQDTQTNRPTSSGVQPSSVENHAHVSTEITEETPKTIRGQIAELIAAATSKDERSRSFLLRVVQPGLAGLMDGSVSTLAPIFATAFATHRPFTAFLVGMAAATGAGISMAFSEALSDDGELTGRGSPVVRGGITGVMTFFGGSLHTLPFLITNLHLALLTAYFVVAFELIIIAAIRHRYFGTSWWLSIVQVVGGGALVFAAALIFGNA
jgi:VIT1/CCC1 family predicted Fe2+/Mn2+ transporter